MSESDKSKEDLWLPECVTKTDYPPASQPYEGECLIEVRGPNDISIQHLGKATDSTTENIELTDLDSTIEFLSRNQIRAKRARINMVLCLHDGSPNEPIICFLEQIMALTEKPQVTVAGGNVSEKITELVDEIEANGNGYEHKDEDEPPSSMRYSHERIVEVEIETFKTSKKSPVPALNLERFREMTHDPDLTKQPKLPDVHTVIIFDFDGSLYESSQKGAIILGDLLKFVRDNNQEGFRRGRGDRREIDDAIALNEDWADQRERVIDCLAPKDPSSYQTGIVIRNYQQGIIMTDTRSARGLKGMHLEQLEEFADGFVKEGMHGRFFDFVPTILQESLDYGLLNVLCTGAPHVLIKPLCKYKLPAITHGNGLRYEVKDGILTGRIEHYMRENREVPYHMGTSRGKARLSGEIIRKGYGLPMSFGDSEGDAGLFSSSVPRMQGIKWDWYGGALLVNGNQEIRKQMDDHYSHAVDDARVQILDPGTAAVNVEGAFKTALQQVYRSDMDNLETAKRQRDILTLYGLSDDEKREIMRPFHFDEVIEAALKTNNVNTRNENDWLRCLQDRGCDRNTIIDAMRKNREFHEERGHTLIPLKRPSSYPPPSNND